MSDSPCIVLVGNLSDGFRAIGPYSSFDDAADAHPGDCWIMSLEPSCDPAGADEQECGHPRYPAAPAVVE